MDQQKRYFILHRVWLGMELFYRLWETLFALLLKFSEPILNVKRQTQMPMSPMI